MIPRLRARNMIGYRTLFSKARSWAVEAAKEWRASSPVSRPQRGGEGLETGESATRLREWRRGDEAGVAICEKRKKRGKKASAEEK